MSLLAGIGVLHPLLWYYQHHVIMIKDVYQITRMIFRQFIKLKVNEAYAFTLPTLPQKGWDRWKAVGCIAHLQKRGLQA